MYDRRVPKPITYTIAGGARGSEAITASFIPTSGMKALRLLAACQRANMFQGIINFCAIDLALTTYIVSDPRCAHAGNFAAYRPPILSRCHAAFYDAASAGSRRNSPPRRRPGGAASALGAPLIAVGRR